ncbi:MAG TPA: hypothetical protein VEB21_04130 [Terriglobales bacterium]|nr:hypothetical protein [Terriglobales bacterium]
MPRKLNSLGRYVNLCEPPSRLRPPPVCARPQTDLASRRVSRLKKPSTPITAYKYAVLLAMLDLCVEMNADAHDTISTARLAERVLELYWPQS